jgi:DNA-binding NarL/FixJ family response regulator
MNLRLRPTRYKSRPPHLSEERSILVIDADDRVRMDWRRELMHAGLGLITAERTLSGADEHMRTRRCDLVFLDISGKDPEARFDFLARVRNQNYRGIVAMVSNTPTLDMCFRAARLGASDFLIKSTSLDIAAEAKRLFSGRHVSRPPLRVSEDQLSLGLFSSLGVTDGEMRVLREFARGFPRQLDIAKRLNREETYIRKTFSRVYEKLGDYFSIRTSAQLSHVLTICSLFDS